jgi:hypothetical protein
MSKLAVPPGQRTSCAARSTWHSPASAIERQSASESSTGSSPIFVQFERKMSAKLGAMIARKP